LGTSTGGAAFRAQKTNYAPIIFQALFYLVYCRLREHVAEQLQRSQDKQNASMLDHLVIAKKYQ